MNMNIYAILSYFNLPKKLYNFDNYYVIIKLITRCTDQI